MENLISMTDFVLSKKYTATGHENYANFLKQPLELWMFIPCDEDGNVLEEPDIEDYVIEEHTELNGSPKEYDLDGYELCLQYFIQAKIKLEEEKEAIYIIRKKRLMEFGMNYSTEHDTFWLDENADYILLKDDIFDYTALEFEKTFSEIEKIITDAKYAIEQAKINTEKAEKQKIIDEKLAKEDAERLKKENKARIKTFAADKKLLIELVESLDFHNALPEMQNDLSEEMLNKFIIDLDELKKGWLNNVNNL